MLHPRARSFTTSGSFASRDSSEANAEFDRWLNSHLLIPPMLEKIALLRMSSTVWVTFAVLGVSVPRR